MWSIIELYINRFSLGLILLFLNQLLYTKWTDLANVRCQRTYTRSLHFNNLFNWVIDLFSTNNGEYCESKYHETYFLPYQMFSTVKRCLVGNVYWLRYGLSFNLKTIWTQKIIIMLCEFVYITQVQLVTWVQALFSEDIS